MDDDELLMKVIDMEINRMMYDINKRAKEMDKKIKEIKCDICERHDIPIIESDVSGIKICLSCLVDMTFKNWELVNNLLENQSKSKKRKVNKEVNPKNNEVIIKK
jgi:hypothetical protein